MEGKVMLPTRCPIGNQDLPKPVEPKAQCGPRDTVEKPRPLESSLGSYLDLITQWLSKLRPVTSPL